MRSALVAVALVALAASGTGCRSTLVEKLEKDTAWGLPYETPKGRYFLGVVVAKESPENAIGLKVERVLANSPAENWGVRPGDEIRQVAGRVVRNAHDLNAALCEELEKSYEVVVAANGEERRTNVQRVTWTERQERVRSQLTNLARKNDSTFTIPLLFLYQHMTIPADQFCAITGLAVTDAVTYYRDVSVLDLLGIITLYRTERCYPRGVWRLTLVFPIYTSGSDGLPDGIVAPGEERYEVF